MSVHPGPSWITRSIAAVKRPCCPSSRAAWLSLAAASTTHPSPPRSVTVGTPLRATGRPSRTRAGALPLKQQSRMIKLARDDVDLRRSASSCMGIVV